jgi:hypothetical protein
VAACLIAALLPAVAAAQDDGGSGRMGSPAVSGPGGELPTEGLILYDQGYSAFEPEVDVSGMTASFSVRFF